MNKRDRAALKLAMTMARKDPLRARQLDGMLAAGRSWQEVAEFAAYSCQFDTLRLKPWETPPIDADDTPGAAARDRFGYFTEPKAVALLKRMKAAGVPRCYPDPMAALAEAEAATPWKW
jgi:hypothetical protein